MGSGTWSAATYRSKASARHASGKDAFHYSSGASGVHPTLDPFGLSARESRDSAEHPESNSIIVGLDVSGSMGRVVRGIHADLPQLLELLLGHGYIPHPQIMFAAFSNGKCDRVPLQVGQFESDNRMDENLENMVLGGPLAGGCDIRESAELLLYVAARHTAIDCYEKRKKRGYLFLITDEMAYEQVPSQQLNAFIGAGEQADIPLSQIVREVQEKYNLYIIIPAGASGGSDKRCLTFWQEYVGAQHVIALNDPQDTSETIALTIGLREGTIDLHTGLDHLRTLGSSAETLSTVSQALSVVPAGSALVQGQGGQLSDLDTSDDDNSSDTRTRRL